MFLLTFFVTFKSEFILTRKNYIKIKFLLIFIIFISTPCDAIDWNGNNWALKCDFPGNDFKNELIKGEDCGKRCEDTLGCTHFAWNNYQSGTCWMKTGQISKDNAVPVNNPSSSCGIIEGFKWTMDRPNNLIFAVACDFYGNDLKRENSSPDQCGPKCKATSECTHFTWIGDFCYMKQGQASKQTLKNIDGQFSLCGFMLDQSSGKFPGGFFKYGVDFAGDSVSDDLYRKYDYLSMWINAPHSDNSKNTDWNPFWNGAMVEKAKRLGKMTLFYAYIIAFQARADIGLQDCDVNPSYSLCNKGANYIRQNRNRLVERYSHQAWNIANAWGDRNKEVIFLMEPDVKFYFLIKN